jgi:hypothetical protein
MNAPLPLSRWPASRALLASIARFDALPADEACPARLAQALRPAGVSVPEVLWTCARSRRHLNQALKHSLGGGCTELGIERAEWRLALLPVQRLRRLAIHVAATVVAGDLRRALSREEVCAWRDWLGQEAYQFAQTSVGLLPIAVPAPEAARHRSLPADSVGAAWLQCASQDWPSPMRARFQLKLPLCDDTAVCTQAPAAAARLANAVLTIVESQWVLSFAMKAR